MSLIDKEYIKAFRRRTDKPISGLIWLRDRTGEGDWVGWDCVEERINLATAASLMRKIGRNEGKETKV